MQFNKRTTRLITDLETVEDKDEKNSSSMATSVQQNNLKDRTGRGETKMSRDFFADEESHIDISINNQPDFEKKNPFPTIMDPVLSRDKSDISALNINESAFDMNESVNDLIQRDDSFLGKDTSFRQFDASNDGVYLESDLNNSEIRKHNVSYSRAQTYAPYDFANGIDVIQEDNENSSSQQHQSAEESKDKIKSNNSLTKK
jgi:hypothetical protein